MYVKIELKNATSKILNMLVSQTKVYGLLVYNNIYINAELIF